MENIKTNNYLVPITPQAILSPALPVVLEPSSSPRNKQNMYETIIK